MSCDTHLSSKGTNEKNFKNVSIDFTDRVPSEKMWMVRGYAIISKGDIPKQIDSKTFVVPSQNDNGEYKVTLKRKPVCTCPDYQKRHIPCKHIHAVRFYLDFNNKVKIENKGIVSERPVCPYCKSSEIVGWGKRHTKSGQKQMYRCKSCGRKFIEEKDFQRYKGNGKITTLIMDLYFKGISLRGIQDHLNQFYSLKLDHSNILRRIQKFSGIIDDYVKTLKPEVADIWHHDEMKIQAGGKWKWLWNVMDEETKFLITTQVSTKARVIDSRKFFNQAREQTGVEPVFLITDGRHSYTRSIKKELPHTQQVRLVKLTDKRTNNQGIERLNGTIRDRVKTMRGFDNQETSETMTSAYRNYYNFIKPHSSLNGSTPALKANIGVSLEGNKWMNLITKATANAKI